MNKHMKYEQIFATSKDRVKEIMKEVHEKSKNDKMFEHELLIHPTETLKKEGLELLQGFSFQIVKTEEEANSLPDNIIPLSLGHEEGAMSQEELEKVAGGCSHDGTSSPHTIGPDGYWSCE